MPSLETLNGKLHVTLHYRREGRVHAVNTVSIRSDRLRLSSRFFTGKSLETVPDIVGMLFSLCGTAQAVASARACERASGQRATQAQEQQRDFRIRVETLFEHLLRLSQDWPEVLGYDAVPAAELQALFKRKRDVLQTAEPEAVLKDIRLWCESRLLGLPTQRWMDYCLRGDAKKLSIRGEIGNLMARLCRYNWELKGDAPLQPLLEFAPRWWEACLVSAQAEHFCAEPAVGGQACETSSLTRQWENPALRVWRERHGSGLMTRLIARVLDMLTELEKLDRAVTPDRKSSLPAPLAGEGPGKGGTPQAGISLLQTARGLLVHRVTQENGLIQSYQIVAPTEWNFHPQGALYHMLGDLTAGSEEELQALARTLITALDPCVDYQLEIIPDA
ncbi:MAG: nickel-dependent hydrogenase large subunit [Thiothrix sp.]